MPASRHPGPLLVSLAVLPLALFAGDHAFGKDAETNQDCFGDLLPPGAVARLGTLRFRHGEDIHRMTFSPDGRLLATAGASLKQVRVWDVATGKCVLELPPRKTAVDQVALSADGKLLGVGGDDGLIRLWDVVQATELRPIPGRGFAFSPDGKTLATGESRIAGRTKEGKELWRSGKTLFFWDLATGKEIRRHVAGQDLVAVLGFSPGGRMLAVQRTNAVCLVHVPTGKEKRRWPGRWGQLWAAFSDDSKSFTICDSAETFVTLQTWDIATGESLHQVEKDDRILLRYRALALSSDGTCLLCLRPNSQVEQIRWESWEVDRRLAVPGFAWDAKPPGFARLRGRVAAFSPDDKVVAFACRGGVIQLFDVATGRAMGPGGPVCDAIGAVAFTANGQSVRTVTPRGNARTWEARTGRILHTNEFPHKVDTTVLSADGATAASFRSGWVYLWNPAAGPETIRRAEANMDPPACFVFSPDQVVLAGGNNEEGRILLWDIGSGRLRRELELLAPPQTKAGGRSQGALCLGFSPDGKFLAGGTRDEDVRVWNVATGRMRYLLQPHAAVKALRFSADGKFLATAGNDRMIRLWEMAGGKERLCRAVDSSCEQVTALALSPDGRLLAFGGSDGAVWRWDLRTCRGLPALVGHRGKITSLAFSADSRFLVSGSGDTTALVWDMSKPETQEKAALGAKRMEAMWQDLADGDAVKAYQAIVALTAAQEGVAFLGRKLAPVPPPDAKKVARLIEDLNHERFAVRDKAAAELARLGELVEPDLGKAAKGDASLEMQRRIEQLLDRLEGPVHQPEHLRWLRAVEVLEAVGTSEARAVLQKLAGGVSGARLTREARASLQRLERRPKEVP
jgi:WD40 repeat protein